DPGVPSGAVTFFDNSTKLVTLPLVGGKVSYTTYLQPGLHSITASYSGDDTRAPGEGFFLNIGLLTVTDIADLTGPIFPDVKHKRSGSQLQSAGPHVHRKVTLENTSGETLRGPLWLALDGLSRRVKVRHRAGLTVAHGTRHSPYVAVPLPG